MYVVGGIGKPPRMIFDCPSEVEANLNQLPGEVLFSVDCLPDRPFLISADGLGLQTRPRPVEEVRSDAWTAALAYREGQQQGGCATPLGRVDTDAVSQRKISGAALAALIAKIQGQPFSIDWTMSDNTIQAHDAEAMIAMGMAVTHFIAACQYAANAIREMLDVADSPEAIAAIDITAGYPT